MPFFGKLLFWGLLSTTLFSGFACGFLAVVWTVLGVRGCVGGGGNAGPHPPLHHRKPTCLLAEIASDRSERRWGLFLTIEYLKKKTQQKNAWLNSVALFNAAHSLFSLNRCLETGSCLFWMSLKYQPPPTHAHIYFSPPPTCVHTHTRTPVADSLVSGDSFFFFSSFCLPPPHCSTLRRLRPSGLLRVWGVKCTINAIFMDSIFFSNRYCTACFFVCVSPPFFF